MGDFDRALAFVLRAEGGFSNDPADHGGATNHGITQETYDRYRTLLELPRRPVAEIEAGEVEQAYRRLFWEPVGAEYLDYPMSLFIFDAAVQHGPEKARTMIGAVQYVDGPEERELYAVLAIRLYLYRRQAATEPTQIRFLRGWENRIENLRREAKL